MKDALRTQRILVLDGETRAGLAVVRSLGKLGVEIGVVAERRSALAVMSHHSYVYFPNVNSVSEPATYLGRLAKIIAAWQPDMVIPITDSTVEAVCDLPESILSRNLIATMPRLALRKASTKGELMKLARGLGIPAPKTLELSINWHEDGATLAAIREFPYPAVIKPDHSPRAKEEVKKNLGVFYVSCADEAAAKISKLPMSDSFGWLMQQQIIGPGVGVFSIASRGKPLATFCHRRLLEKPPSGGVSVLSESIPLAEAPVKDANRLLEELSWDGVAMIEFKKHTDGLYYLVEINPRFWGSLQLAVDSGVNFPTLLFRLHTAKQSQLTSAIVQPNYKVGQRLRWTLGSVDHLLIKLKENPLQTIKELFAKNSLMLFERPWQTSQEVWRWNDPTPTFAEIYNWFRGR